MFVEQPLALPGSANNIRRPTYVENDENIFIFKNESFNVLLENI